MGFAKKFRKDKRRAKRLERAADNSQLLALAELLIMNLDFEEARKVSMYIVSKDPSLMQAWYFLGQCELILKNFDEAEKAFLVAGEGDPDLYQVNYFLGQIYLETGRYDEAREIAVGQIELHTGNPNMVNHVPYMWQLKAEAELQLTGREAALSTLSEGSKACGNHIALSFPLGGCGANESNQEQVH